MYISLVYTLWYSIIPKVRSLCQFQNQFQLYDVLYGDSPSKCVRKSFFIFSDIFVFDWSPKELIFNQNMSSHKMFMPLKNLYSAKKNVYQKFYIAFQRFQSRPAEFHAKFDSSILLELGRYCKDFRTIPIRWCKTWHKILSK